MASGRSGGSLGRGGKAGASGLGRGGNTGGGGLGTTVGAAGGGGGGGGGPQGGSAHSQGMVRVSSVEVERRESLEPKLLTVRVHTDGSVFCALPRGRSCVCTGLGIVSSTLERSSPRKSLIGRLTSFINETFRNLAVGLSRTDTRNRLIHVMTAFCLPTLHLLKVNVHDCAFRCNSHLHES